MSGWPHDLERLGISAAGGSHERRTQAGVPELHSFEDVAALCGCSPRTLASVLLGPRRHNQYRSFQIAKRSGGKRRISVPSAELQLYQRRLLAGVLSLVRPSAAAMGFTRGRSIVDNARSHVGAQIVVRIDIKDFFPSIRFRRIRTLFEHLGYGPGMSAVLGLLVSEPGPAPVGERRFRLSEEELAARRLPQGAPTSPALANLACRGLDERLLGLVRVHGEPRWTYTRYADDLFFSTAAPRVALGRFLAAVHRILEWEGFALNPRKTIVMRRPRRLLVTGLLVDGDSVRLPRTYRRRLRALLHSVHSQGFDAATERLGRDARAVVAGHLAYVAMVEPELLAALHAQHDWLATATGPRTAAAATLDSPGPARDA